MASAALQLMTVDEFFVWQQSQEERYELVDGVPVMMNGANTPYDTVPGNVRMPMASAALKLMSVEEFFVWQQSQEERFELVDGVPVMMSGASTRHDTVTTNVIAALHAQLRGKPCRPGTADVGIRTRIRSLRRADVLVYCDPPRDDVYEADDIRLIVEVLSPSNRGIRWQRKIEEYRGLTKLAYVLLIEPDAAQATLLTRSGEAWSSEDWDGLEGVIELQVIEARLAMADIYDGLGL